MYNAIIEPIASLLGKVLDVLRWNQCNRIGKYCDSNYFIYFISKIVNASTYCKAV